VDDFKLFDILPSGVIIFKDKKVQYINQHLLDVLSIGNFSIKNSVNIIVKILNVENEEELFLFFNNKEYFRTQNKVIQIDSSHHDDYCIFSFMHVNETIVTESLPIQTQGSDNTDIDEEITKHFKLNNIKNVTALTFYKGIPLKNTAKIIRINNDSIEMIVDSKHNISLQERDDILLITNTKKGSAALHGHIINGSNNTFKINNFYVSKDDMHLRKGVRVKPDRNIIINVDKKEFKVYDISTKGVSIHIDNEEEEELLKSISSTKVLLDDKEVELSVKYLKTISDNDTVLKVIFTLNTIGDDSSILNQYIVDKQNEILREIHQYQKDS